MVSRRTYIGGLAGGVLAGLAGCVGDGFGRDPTPTDIPTATLEQTRTDTEVPATETPSPPYRLEPKTYRTIVVYRNDDPRPNYRFDALVAVENVFLEAGVPLTHGVIPAFDAPLERESAFCDHLRERARQHPGMFEIALHGYTHAAETTFYGVSEFGDLTADEQRERVADGMALLASCLDVEDPAFIAPFNTYDHSTVAAAVAAGIDVVSGGTWFTDLYYETEAVPFETDGALHVPSNASFVDDWSTNEFHDLPTMQATFDAAADTTGLHVQMLHYHHFSTPAHLEQLRAFVDYVDRQEGVGYMTLGQFGAAYRDGSLQRVEGGWRYDPV